MARAMILITLALLASLPLVPIGKKKIRIFDRDIGGFILEVHAAGYAYYFFRYTDPRGRQREIKLGRVGDAPLTKVRARAKELRAKVTLHGDPAGDIDRMRAIPTFADFVAERYFPHIRTKLAAGTVADYESICRRQLVPALGRKHLDEITRADIAALRSTLILSAPPPARLRRRGGTVGTNQSPAATRALPRLSPARVNRVLVVLRGILSLALRWGIIVGENPAGNPDLLREEPRDRYLTETELLALIAALGADRDHQAAAAIALLVLTGARRSEIVKARWEHVDLNLHQLTVPKAKGGKRRYIPLSDKAEAVLCRLDRSTGSPFLFPSSRRPGQPLEGLRGAWTRVKAAARLAADLRVHDLRHAYASFLANRGYSIPQISQILGHAQASTTQRYVHIAQHTLIEAANVVGGLATLPPQGDTDKAK